MGEAHDLGRVARDLSAKGSREPSYMTEVKPSPMAARQTSASSPWSRWTTTGTDALSASDWRIIRASTGSGVCARAPGPPAG
jgi:hypothetical protein